MSKITNDGLSRSGTGCFIAVPIWQLWASRVRIPGSADKRIKDCTVEHACISSSNSRDVDDRCAIALRLLPHTGWAKINSAKAPLCSENNYLTAN